MKGRITTRLDEVQTNPRLIATLGITSLAWLIHEAEYEGDDVTFLALMDMVERQYPLNIWRDEYMRLWPEHAKARGYQRGRRS